MSRPDELYRKAQRHLSRRDEVLKKIIKEIGPCTLTPDADHFNVLVRAIVAQQISTKAAKSIYAKVQIAVGNTVRPDKLLAVEEEALQQAGLSTSKRRYVLDLAQKVHGGEVRLHETGDMSDEDVIQHLLPVKGIGRWTAEMFLIFGLGRMDVLPIADLGLRVGVQKQYALAEVPGKEQLVQMAEAWRPYRSVGTWYMWRTFGNNVPQS
jgi:DNA-3-methyladenine glycosylase II